jgi:GNAT superfamily N-acetyltransferase
VDALTCDCSLDVLVHESAKDVPLGWICYEGDLVHYVYTIPKARRKGVGTLLLKHVNGTRLSHTTEGGIALWEKTR